MNFLPSILAGVAVALCVRVLLARRPVGAVADSARQWVDLFSSELRRGAVDDPGAHDRRLWLGMALAGGIVGWSLGGMLLAGACAAAAPIVLVRVLAHRRVVRARAVDSCAGEFAAALASTLAAGQSVRGALLEAPASVPEPLATELRFTAARLALGDSTSDALAALCSQTGSPRIESMVGAIELHRGSGGDLVGLLRELAAAFRERERARDDAHSASAQARFTTIVVAAIPLVLGVVVELAKPGAVSGAFAFAPSAVMLMFSALLMAAGGWLCFRIARTG